MSWFESWFDTEWYHELYAHRSHEEADAFVLKLMAHLNLTKGSKLLDIACGKGRHAKSMHELGFEVTGIDLSANSIKEAKQSEKDGLTFAVHDMREVFARNEYDAAFNYFTSFGYFETEKDNIRAAQAFAESLKPNALLIIDYVNKAHALRNMESKGKLQEVRGENVYDISYRFEDNRFKKKIVVNDQYEFEEQVQALTLKQFKSYFEPLGMQLKEVFGNYSLEAYEQEQSARLIMIFKK